MSLYNDFNPASYLRKLELAICATTTADMCKDYIIETSWGSDVDTEGFLCALVKGHEGDHIAKSNHVEVLEGVTEDGRKYEYEFHWRYVE